MKDSKVHPGNPPEDGSAEVISLSTEVLSTDFEFKCLSYTFCQGLPYCSVTYRNFQFFKVLHQFKTRNALATLFDGNEIGKISTAG